MNKKSKLLWLLVAITLTGCFGVMNVLAWPVPDTGQTKCYDNEKEIPCPLKGQAFYGQDGNYTINPMSYSKLDATGNDLADEATSWAMVRDNVTGLIWENKQNKDGVKNYANPHDADNTYTWYDSNPETNGGDAGTPGDGLSTFDTEQFINALNAAFYGGHNDWRVPSIRELDSIVNYAIPSPGPAINTGYFLDTVASVYWSSTTTGFTFYAAWKTLFSKGGHFYDDKERSYCVRAVCGGKSVSLLDHLVINGDGTVTDTDTGLMWQQAIAPGGNNYNWQQALDYCEKLNLAGSSNWRLPTINELNSLLDYDGEYSINTDYFPDTVPCVSSTTDAKYNLMVWEVNFRTGTDGTSGAKSVIKCFVRAVSGGQSGSLDHLVTLSPRQASSWNIGAVMPIRWETDGLGTNIKISLSHQGGKAGTFETIIEATPNDGNYDWTITGAESVNCVIKIESADNAANWALEGLFVIKKGSAKSAVNPGIFLLLLE